MSSVRALGPAPCAIRKSDSSPSPFWRRLVERGDAAVLGLIGVGTALDEQPGDGFVAGRDGTVERLDPDRAGCPCVRVGSPVEELLGDAQAAEEGGQVEGREAVARALVDRPGVGLVEQLGEPAQVANDRGLEAVEVGLCGEDALEDGRLALVGGHGYGRQAGRVARPGEVRPLRQQPVDGHQVAGPDRPEQLVAGGHRDTVAASTACGADGPAPGGPSPARRHG